METETLQDSFVHESYQIIHTFFDAFYLPDALQLVRSSIYSSLSPAYWHKQQPSDLIHFTEQLTLLCQAAFIINETNTRDESAIICKPDNDIPDITLTDTYVHHYKNSNAWNSFPRSLTTTQFFNPYEAINKFFGHMRLNDWKTFLKELLYYALSTELITDTYEVHDVLKAEKRLLQMIEACHLIEVRV